MQKRNSKKVDNSNFYLEIRRRIPFRKANPKVVYQKTVSFIRRRPFVSFLISLLILLGLIVTGNMLAPKPKVEQKAEIVKPIQIYKVGESPKITLQGKIEKSGVIKITSLVPGVASKINFFEGQIVDKGTILLSLASNYQGGNAASLSRQLSATQNTNTKQTFDTQKEIVRLQRELAHKADTSADELRSITDKSLQDSRDLIDLNQSIINTLNENERELRENNSGGINDALILQTQQQRAATQAGLNQLRSGLRANEFQTASDKAPAQISDIQKDLALKQLDIQEKALDLSLKISGLQLQIAQVTEAQFYPSSPFAAKIQRVHVKEGQAINPGTVLMTISAIEDPIHAIVSVPQDIAANVSTLEESKVILSKTDLMIRPTLVSTEATEGTLYSIIYTIPDGYISEVVEGGYVAIEIPVGLVSAGGAIPFIPLDSVFQSGSSSFIFVARGDKAESKEVKLGNVFGRFVEVISGLNKGDQVILNRNILAGDKVRVD